MKPRFYVKENGYIVDRLNWTNNDLAWTYTTSKDQSSLREKILGAQCRELLLMLMPKKLRSKKIGVSREEIASALVKPLVAIGDANLGKDKAIPSRFAIYEAKVKRANSLLQNITSIGLLLNDVEPLMWNLYGGFDNKNSKNLRQAMVGILKLALKRENTGLWEEYDDACLVDGDDRLPGHAPSKADVDAEIGAGGRIVARARKIRENPRRYSKYTIQFVSLLDENWKAPDEGKPSSENRDEKRITDEESFYKL